MSAGRLAEPVGRRAAEPDAIAPDGSEVRVLVEAAHGARGASLCEITLGPGQVSRPVAHRTVEEVWYVLAGSGRVWRSAPDAGPDGGITCGVGPGDALAIPVGWRFQFAAGPEGLSFLCHTAPPWPGEQEAEPAGPGGLGEPTV